MEKMWDTYFFHKFRGATQIKNSKLQQIELTDGRISLYLEYYLGREEVPVLDHVEKYTRAIDKLKEDAMNSLPDLDI